MNNFYNIEDALSIPKIKAKYRLVLILLGVLTLSIIIFLTILSLDTIVMIIDIILSTAYFSFLYTYLTFIRKEYNEKYHFYAKIEQFDHEYFEGEIVVLEEDVITVDSIEVNTIKVGSRTLFIENKVLQKHPDICLGNNIKVDIVDKFIVGYEVILNE